jgi:hypothetical protein
MGEGHRVLREHWKAYEPLRPILLDDFLQGSYRRRTAIRPAGGKRSDVDVVVVTKLSEVEYSPTKAHEVLRPFLDKHYNGLWSQQGRSIGIKLDAIEMDLVLTSAPKESQVGLLKAASAMSDDALSKALSWDPASEAVDDSEVVLMKAIDSIVEWKSQAIRIPNRDAKRWEDTHPLAQWRWTVKKNAACNGHFIGVVLALKWWQATRQPSAEKPRGYPLERIIAECCPDGIPSVADGVTRTLEAIANRFGFGKPVIQDHGTDQDVLLRLSANDFATFYQAASVAAKVSRRALDADSRAESCALWRDLFGERFPAPPSDGGDPPKGGFSRREGPSEPSHGRFA